MQREQMVEHLVRETHPWDLLIIGGGATGLGAAVDGASRGFRTLLFEQSDFAKATSSRSTKLIHGGVRYLQQGNISLVTEALHERGLLCQNAPHLIHHLPFLVPIYHWWEGPFYGSGLKIYDMLAGKLGLEPSIRLSKEKTLAALPTIEPKDLRGGVVYYDGQFDDARLAITLAQTAADEGACLINYCRVESLLKKAGRIIGVIAHDTLNNKRYEIHAKVVINATGIFADQIAHMDSAKAPQMIAPSQGVHLILDKSFQPGKMAILVPHTDDGRVVFLVPWQDRVLIGTTDNAVKEPSLEPFPMEQEVDFLLKYAGRYLTKDPKRKDVLSMFAGLRPLIKPDRNQKSSKTSREHLIRVHPSGLITIAGGKWTTYRKMAQDVIDQAIVSGGLRKRACATEQLPLHGSKKTKSAKKWATQYGTDISAINDLIKEKPLLAKPLHKDLPYVAAQVVWAARHEMAETVEDVLARRTRALLLNARASMEIAPKVAALMAKEKGYSDSWQKSQVKAYCKLASHYFPK